MSSRGYPKKSAKFEIQAYEKPKDMKQLSETHVAFTGSPQKHPYDAEKVILVPDPFSTNTFYYEFKKTDISYVEELPTLVNAEGETVSMVRIWVRKMCIGLRCAPFVVEDTTWG
jgi:inorganic pyrophosphatase